MSLEGKLVVEYGSEKAAEVAFHNICLYYILPHYVMGKVNRKLIEMPVSDEKNSYEFEKFLKKQEQYNKTIRKF